MKHVFIVTVMLMALCSCNKSDDDKKEEEDVPVATYLEMSPSTISIGKTASSTYINVKSNTDWTVYVNNSGDGITELDVTPLSGTGDGTIQIKYGKMDLTKSREMCTVVIQYKSNGYKESKTSNLVRMNMGY